MLICAALVQPCSMLGAVSGRFLEFAADRGIDCYGFDASEAQVERAQANHKKVVRALSVPEYVATSSGPSRSRVNMTLCRMFLNVAARSTFNATWGIRSVLTSHGLLFMSVPGGSLNSAKVKMRAISGRSYGLIPWEHVFYHSRRSLRMVVENAGFEVVALGGVMPYQRPMNAHEVVRRAMHHMLRPTALALQLFVLARPQVAPAAR